MSEDYKAPPGMFRVIGVDQFSHEQWGTGDYATKEEALQVARTKTLKASEFATDSSIATVFHAYDDQGKLLG